MRGHARERGAGKWELRVFLGRDPLTERKRYRTKTVTARGRREANRALAAFVAGADRAAPGPDADITFGELVERWTATASLGWSPSNEVTVRRIVAFYLEPLLGVRIDRLRTADLDRFYAQLSKGGGRGGRPLSVATVRRVHSVVRSALAQAVRWQWLAVNPATAASPGPAMQTALSPPGPEAVAALLERAEADSPDFAVFLVVAAVTGARRGELLALRWTDLDSEAATITIARAICEGVNGPVERPRPKTAGSVRRIALDRTTVGVLVAHRARMAERAVAEGTTLPAKAFVFSHYPDGSVPWRPGFVSLKFRRLRDELGLGQLRLHDLRHFVATTLLGAGVDLRTVAGRLGHAGGGRTTLAVYAHFQQASDRGAAELLGDLLARPGQQPHGAVDVAPVSSRA